MLELKNIYKRYTTGEFTQTALDNVNLRFRESEFAAILGPSGSGKTTLLNIAGGLAQYDEGDLIINGHSTKTFKDSDWDAYRNNSVGFIFQSYNLITHLTVLDNVLMGMTLSGVPKEERKSRGISVLEQVGLGEHLHKKPNQLSGGQMQRVAIARSLVNNPDIILADEPTGALDTKTSEQIMDLIAEIAHEKLVIMVTHNSELAEQYANRIIEFRDGEVVRDSNPVVSSLPASDYEMKRTSMSFWSALKLSGKNITTKKWRTGLISFASSIGIIGIALVLSLSNGFDKQITSVENDTLSGYPITISKVASELSMGPSSHLLSEKEETENLKQRETQLIYSEKIPAEEAAHENNLTTEFIDYLREMDATQVSGVGFGYELTINLLKKTEEEVSVLSDASVNFASYPSGKDNDQSSFLRKNFDLLSGAYPKSDNELILVIGENNQLSESIVSALGFEDEDSFSFENIIGYELQEVPNNEYFMQEGDFYKPLHGEANLKTLYQQNTGTRLKVVGVFRAKEGIEIVGVSEGLKYSEGFVEGVIAKSKNSDIVKAQQIADFNVMTGEPFVGKVVQQEKTGRMSSAINESSSVSTSSVTKDQLLTRFGADERPGLLTIYPKDFAAKEEVLTYLDAWNKGKEKKEKIEYTDMAATVSSLMGDVLNGITIVLVAFAAISLIVSLIMIGIITYISVMERTKEIGVLRALGARKKDITRVFNAETFIIGTCSGLLGIGVAYLLTIPINIVLEQMTSMVNIAQLNPVHAALLALISVCLTMLGGMIPSKMAAKKDPVEALGSE